MSHSLIPGRPGWTSGGSTFPEAVRLLALHLTHPPDLPLLSHPAPLLLVAGASQVLGLTRHPPPQEPVSRVIVHFRDAGPLHQVLF